MRIVSWNIELGRRVERASAEIQSLPDLADADILLVQEMDPDGVAKLAARLGMEHRYEPADTHPYTKAPFGNAVLSPWPVGDAERIPLPHAARFAGQNRLVTGCTVEVDGQTVRAYSVHLETVMLPLRRRLEQVEALVNELEPAGSEPLIVGGDFNSASTRSVRATDAVFQRMGMERLTPDDVPTFKRFSRTFTLDHMYGHGVTLDRSGVAGSVAASDHFPIWAELTVQEPLA